MNKSYKVKTGIIFVITILLIGIASTLYAATGKVTTSPAADSGQNIIINKGDTVTFTVDPGIDTIVSCSGTFENTGGAYDGDFSDSIDVTFGADAEGKSSACTITLSTESNDGTHTVCSSSATITFHVIIPKAEIVINKTTATNDDIVRLKSTIPNKRFKVPCQLQIQPILPQDIAVVLTNPGGKLRFPEAADVTKALTVPSNTSSVDFEISGESASNSKDDATIEAHKSTATGSKLGEKKATVFSFDPSDITVGQGGSYGFGGPSGVIYEVVQPLGSAAVNYSAAGVLKPTGLDSDSPQLKDIRIGIMQKVLSASHEAIYGNPTLVVSDPSLRGQKFDVAKEIHQTISIPGAANDVSDPVGVNAPLYSKNAAALKKPTGYPGGGPATASDAPQVTTFLSVQGPLYGPSGNVVIGTLTFSRDKATIDDAFKTWAVTYDITTGEIIPLRETGWKLNADSKKKNQRANPDAKDKAASEIPPTTPIANNIQVPGQNIVGTTKVVAQ